MYLRMRFKARSNGLDPDEGASLTTFQQLDLFELRFDQFRPSALNCSFVNVVNVLAKTVARTLLMFAFLLRSLR